MKLRHFHRFIRRCQREVDEAAHFLDFFFLNEVQRVEALDLSRNLAGKRSRVKAGDAVHADVRALARRLVEHGRAALAGAGGIGVAAVLDGQRQIARQADLVGSEVQFALDVAAAVG